MYNSNDVLVATDYEEFSWDADLEWRTVNNMQYPAYTGGACFDDARYDVVYFENLQQDTAWANLRIHYTSGFIC